MSIEAHLVTEIESEFTALSGIEVGSEAYKTTVDGVTKLLDRMIEIDKLEFERDKKAESDKKEEEFRRMQMEEEKKDRLIRNCLSAAGIVIPTIVTIWGTVKSIEFEKEGTITTIMGRGFIQKLLPKK